jgi:multiple sugar transport system permease protein
VPLSTGALATLFVLSLLASWNDYLWPLIVLTSPTILTLPVGIASFQSEYNSFPGIIMAGALIATVPVLAIFTALQRFIVQSVASAGLKG